MTIKSVSRRWIKPKRRPPAPPPGPPPPPPNVYASWREFFVEALSVWYCRAVLPDALNPAAAAHYSWCPEWTAHPEAVERVRLLWLSWEEANRAKNPGTALAGWWVHTADPMMRELLATHGTFCGCSIRAGSHQPDYVPLPD